MEKIIDKIIEKEIYHIERYFKISEKEGSFVLSNSKENLIRVGVPNEKVSALLKQNSSFWEKLYGEKYASQYVIDFLPYYENEWKKFVYCEYIDGKELCRHNDFPQSLITFFQNYDEMFALFQKELKQCLANFKTENEQSSMMALFWTFFSQHFVDKKGVLETLYSLSVAISHDKSCVEKVRNPINVEAYLALTQYLNAAYIDYVQLANDYIMQIYDYLLFCYRADEIFLDAVAKEKGLIVRKINLDAYSKNLLFYKAVNWFITCFSF